MRFLRATGFFRRPGRITLRSDAAEKLPGQSAGQGLRCRGSGGQLGIDLGCRLSDASRVFAGEGQRKAESGRGCGVWAVSQTTSFCGPRRFRSRFPESHRRTEDRLPGTSRWRQSPISEPVRAPPVGRIVTIARRARSWNCQAISARPAGISAVYHRTGPEIGPLGQFCSRSRERASKLNKCPVTVAEFAFGLAFWGWPLPDLTPPFHWLAPWG